VVIAETGSGKTTQLPQYAADDGVLGAGLVICTQPRAMAATSIAKRVAEEFDGRGVGDSVGYLVGGGRGGRGVNRGARILFTTDAALIRMAQHDGALARVSTLIIDEAHERSLNTDIVVGIAKRILAERRSGFHVVIASATIDPDAFVRFFGCGEPLCARGRTFEVEVEYLPATATREGGFRDAREEIREHVVPSVAQAMRQRPEGHALVFLPGKAEIETALRAFPAAAAAEGFDDDELVALPLYGQLPPEEQDRVLNFDRDEASDGARMVVFCTNVAETSLTVAGVKIVVDEGRVKEARYEPRRQLQVIELLRVTVSSANQRKGRAGRTSPGYCLRLYDVSELRASSDPEIVRTALDAVVLQLYALGIDPRSFEYLTAPESDLLDQASRTLVRLGCVDAAGRITATGRLYADSAFAPRQCALVSTMADPSSCTAATAAAADLAAPGTREVRFDLACDVAALLSAPGSIFFVGSSTNRMQRTAEMAEAAAQHESDLVHRLEVFRAWRGAGALSGGGQCATCGKSARREGCSRCRIKHAMAHGLNNKVLSSVLDASGEVHALLRGAALGREGAAASPARARDGRAPALDSVEVRDLIGFALSRVYHENYGALLISGNPKAGLHLHESGILAALQRASTLSQRGSVLAAAGSREREPVRHVIAMSVTRLPDGRSFADTLHPVTERTVAASGVDTQSRDLQMCEAYRRDNCGEILERALSTFVRDVRAAAHAATGDDPEAAAAAAAAAASGSSPSRAGGDDTGSVMAAAVIAEAHRLGREHWSYYAHAAYDMREATFMLVVPDRCAPAAARALGNVEGESSREALQYEREIVFGASSVTIHSGGRITEVRRSVATTRLEVPVTPPWVESYIDLRLWAEEVAAGRSGRAREKKPIAARPGRAGGPSGGPKGVVRWASLGRKAEDGSRGPSVVVLADEEALQRVRREAEALLGAADGHGGEVRSGKDGLRDGRVCSVQVPSHLAVTEGDARRWVEAALVRGGRPAADAAGEIERVVARYVESPGKITLHGLAGDVDASTLRNLAVHALRDASAGAAAAVPPADGGVKEFTTKRHGTRGAEVRVRPEGNPRGVLSEADEVAALTAIASHINAVLGNRPNGHPLAQVDTAGFGPGAKVHYNRFEITLADVAAADALCAAAGSDSRSRPLATAAVTVPVRHASVHDPADLAARAVALCGGGITISVKEPSSRHSGGVGGRKRGGADVGTVLVEFRGGRPSGVGAAAQLLRDVTAPAIAYFRQREERTFVAEEAGGARSAWAGSRLERLALELDCVAEVDWIELDRRGDRRAGVTRVRVYGPGHKAGALIREIGNRFDRFRDRYEAVPVEEAVAGLLADRVSGVMGRIRTALAEKQLPCEVTIAYLPFDRSIELYARPAEGAPAAVATATVVVRDVLLEQGVAADRKRSGEDASGPGQICCYCGRGRDTGEALGRLKICGHGFHRSCLGREVSTAWTVPIDCAECDTPIHVHDLGTCSEDRLASMVKTAAVEFVTSGRAPCGIAVCPAEGCTCLSVSASQYDRCPECRKEVCSRCGSVDNKFHRGVSCEKARELEERAGSLDAEIQAIAQRAEKWARDQWAVYQGMNVWAQVLNRFDLVQGVLNGTALAFQRFKAGLETLSTPDALESGIFAWHGTSEAGIMGICDEGFDPGRRCGQAYGPGEYFGVSPATSGGYASSSSRMIVTYILPGAHLRTQDQYSTNWARIVKNPVHWKWSFCLPVAVVSYGSITTPPAFRLGVDAACDNEDSISGSWNAPWRWSWQENDGKWHFYRDRENSMLESMHDSYLGGGPSSVQTDKIERVLKGATPEREAVYVIDFKGMKQRNQTTGFERSVQRQREAALADAGRVWEYAGDGGAWAAFESVTQIELDRHYNAYIHRNGQSTVRVEVPGRDGHYTIDFSKGIQVHSVTQRVRQIRRR
jgi:hypothetical protein